jgi:hypothetical protein
MVLVAVLNQESFISIQLKPMGLLFPSECTETLRHWINIIQHKRSSQKEMVTSSYLDTFPKNASKRKMEDVTDDILNLENILKATV